jgi:hypothetical protein
MDQQDLISEGAKGPVGQVVKEDVPVVLHFESTHGNGRSSEHQEAADAAAEQRALRKYVWMNCFRELCFGVKWTLSST